MLSLLGIGVGPLRPLFATFWLRLHFVYLFLLLFFCFNAFPFSLYPPHEFMFLLPLFRWCVVRGPVVRVPSRPGSVGREGASPTHSRSKSVCVVRGVGGEPG